jgi:transcriptional regulator with XRE-family HTH domain
MSNIDTESHAGWVKARRAELGRFLRGRREQLSPAESQDTSSGRRRVRGLRRDEVAALANIGLSWYTMLEQGRVENVSPRTLLAVARALRLSGVERQHLTALAASSFEELNVNEAPPPRELLNFIEKATVGMVFIVSPLFEVTAYNEQADRFFRFSAQGPQPNLLRLMLTDPHMPTRFIEPSWQTVLRSMVGHFRLWASRVGGPAFESLIGELRAHPQFRALWDVPQIVSPPSERSLLMLPDVGSFLVNVMAFTSFICPTYTLIMKTLVEPDLVHAHYPSSAPGCTQTGPMGPAIAARRRELGAFLRDRRERLSPAQVGLRTTGRRHAKGLRRDEVAERAGIGLSWYAMLEQGRVENVTPKTLRTVADALNLAHRERQYLERLSVQSFDDFAGFDRTVTQDLLRLVRSFPDAHAHFHDANFDMLAWNAEAEQFYEYSRYANPNMLRTMVQNPRLRTAFVAPTWEESLARMLAHYRFTHALFCDSDSASLITELVRESPDFARIWENDRSVADPGLEHGTLDYPSGRRQVHVLILTPTSLPTYTLILKLWSDTPVAQTLAGNAMPMTGSFDTRLYGRDANA